MGIPKELKEKLEKQQYRIVGNHSAVKICHWTKSSLRNGPVCYKQKFYGIKSHRCMQMTTNLTCSYQCIYCWRSIESTKVEMGEKQDPPDMIIRGSIGGQRKLLSGFKGSIEIDKWKESQNPTNVALSLIGEAVDYDYMAELIKNFHERGITTFLVTTGQYPERLEVLRDQQPYQLYISLDAPDPQSYMRLDRPEHSDFWERHLKSLNIMRSFSCRKVCRITAIKGENMKNIQGYIDLLERGLPDYVEVKAYSHIGDSQSRLTRGHQPSMQEIRDFSMKVAENSAWKFKDEDENSKVVLLERIRK